MKKVITILMCLILAAVSVFGMAACGGTEDTEKETPTIRLSKTTLTLKVGEEETLTAEPSVEGAAVTWSSSDSSVAIVSAGKVTAVAVGTATITAKAGEASANCAVTVEEAQASEPESQENPWTMPGVTAGEFNEDFTEFYPNCSSFGQGVILNKQLADTITGPYKFSFTLDATAFEAGQETWISILGSWNETTGNCLRTGIHFVNGAMNTISAYGPCNANSNLNFTNIVEAAKYPESFPNIKEAAFRVDFVLAYDEDENIVAALYMNDILVWFLNYTEYYGGAFTFTDTEYVGFDVFNTVLYEFTISDISLTNFEDSNYVIPDLVSLEDRAKEEAAQQIADTLKAANWQNVNANAAATAEDAQSGTKITFSAASGGFGGCVIWNPALAGLVTSGYELSFTVDVTQIGSTETWLGIMPAWWDAGNAVRMAIHWNQGGVVGLTNFAGYGTVNGADGGFSPVVAPAEIADLTTDCMSTFTVKVQLKEQDGSIWGILFIDDVQVMTYDFGTKYTDGFDFSSIEAIGFDYVGAANGLVLSDFSFSLLAE